MVLQIFVLTFREKSGLNQVILRFRCFCWYYHGGLYHIEPSPLLCKSMDQFLYDRIFRHERVNNASQKNHGKKGKEMRILMFQWVAPMEQRYVNQHKVIFYGNYVNFLRTTHKVGSYRGGSLAMWKGLSGPEPESVKKKAIKVFKDF